MDDKTVDKAEAIARLVDLHAEGKISDEELVSLRAEVASPAKKKLKVLPFAAIGLLAFVGAVSVFVLLSDDGDSAEQELHT